MIKYLELALSQEVYEYLEELDEMNWSARGDVLNQYLRNTSIGTTVTVVSIHILFHKQRSNIDCLLDSCKKARLKYL
jgi:endo-1,4-beta-mannosidase